MDPGAIRLLMYQVHYRQKLDLTDEALAAASEGARRLGEFRRRLRASVAVTDAPEFLELADRLDRDAAAALDDDLNAPRAVAALFAFMTAGNAALDAGRTPGPKTVAAWDRVDGVLGVAGEVTAIRVTGDTAITDGGPTDLSEAPPEGQAAQQAWALGWAVRRKQAKTGRDFAEADRIRDRLKAAGWDVRDARDGSVEVVRRP